MYLIIFSLWLLVNLYFHYNLVIFIECWTLYLREFRGNLKLEMRGIQHFGISGPHWKTKSCLGPHIKYIGHIITKKCHNVLSKFMILCWAAFTAILGCCMWATGCRLEVPAVDDGIFLQVKSTFASSWQLGKGQVMIIWAAIEMIQRRISSVKAGWFPGQSYVRVAAHWVPN